jgi:hypothetical protein
LEETTRTDQVFWDDIFDAWGDILVKLLVAKVHEREFGGAAEQGVVIDGMSNGDSIPRSWSASL